MISKVVEIKNFSRQIYISLGIILAIGSSCIPANAQIKKKMNIADIVLQPSKVVAFINTEFDNYTQPKKLDLLKQSHFLYTKKFNAAPRRDIQYCIWDFPIKDIFAYQSEKQYALYLNITFQKRMLDSLVHSLGKPNNVLEEDLLSGDFDFLHWGKKDAFQVWLTSSRSEENDVTLIITNMPIDSLANLEPIAPD